MKPLSLFNVPICKTLSLVALILLLAVSGSRSSAMEVSIDNVSYFNTWGTNCAEYMQIMVRGSIRATDYDRGISDYMAFVIYDAYGNIIVYIGSYYIHVGNHYFGFGPALDMQQAPLARPFTVTFFDTTHFAPSLSEVESSPLLASFTFDPADFGECTHLPLIGESTEPLENPSFRDGRINNFDMAAPVVVYGHDYETGRGLVVYSPEGALLLEVRPEAIASVEDCPAENTLIVSSGDVAFYRLSSCLYQLNAPSLDGTKTYVLIFDSLYTPAYTSYEE